MAQAQIIMKQRLITDWLPIFIFVGVFFVFGTVSRGEDPEQPEASNEGVKKEELIILTPHQLRHPRAMGKIERQTRGKDPFGIAMTEEKARAQNVIFQQQGEVEDEDELPRPENILEEALQKITIRGVRPREKIVMIGARPVGVGKILEIKHEGVLFRMRLDDVSSRRLVLTDLVTKDQIQLPLKILPETFTRISNRNGGNPAPPSGASRMASTIIIE